MSMPLIAGSLAVILKSTVWANCVIQGLLDTAVEYEQIGPTLPGPPARPKHSYRYRTLGSDHEFWDKPSLR